MPLLEGKKGQEVQERVLENLRVLEIALYRDREGELASDTWSLGEVMILVHTFQNVQPAHLAPIFFPCAPSCHVAEFPVEC